MSVTVVSVTVTVRLKFLFTMTVKIDGQREPVDIKCAYVSF